MISERRAIGMLARELAGSRRGASGVIVGIGDDAAVIESPGGPLVLTSDAVVEGVHFRRGWLSFEDLGWRATHAAASDLAAMGARPLAALSSLIVPRGTRPSTFSAIGRGQAAAARALSCLVVGGNIARGRELSITTALVGVARRPLTRGGAKPGDAVWLVGAVGLARAGLTALEAGVRSRKVAAAVAAWRRPRALIRAGVRLAPHATSCIDVSDGLAGDAGHVAEASRVRVVLELPALARALAPSLRGACVALGLDPVDTALSGGEDYALVLTSRSRLSGARRIGRVERGRGVVLEDDFGRQRSLPAGFDHLARGNATGTRPGGRRP